QFQSAPAPDATQVISEQPTVSDSTAALPLTPTDQIGQSDELSASAFPEDNAALDAEDDEYAEEEEKKRSPWFWPIIGVVILALLAGIGLWAASLGSDQEPEPEPTETAATIEIDEDDYIGRDIDEVAEELEALGFTVDRVERDATEAAGTVLALRPTGEVEEGSEIRVSYSNGEGVEPQPAPEPDPTTQQPAPDPTTPQQQQPAPDPTTQAPAPTTQAPAPTTPQQPAPTTPDEPAPTTPEGPPEETPDEPSPGSPGPGEGPAAGDAEPPEITSQSVPTVTEPEPSN